MLGAVVCLLSPPAGDKKNAIIQWLSRSNPSFPAPKISSSKTPRLLLSRLIPLSACLPAFLLLVFLDCEHCGLRVYAPLLFTGSKISRTFLLNLVVLCFNVSLWITLTHQTAGLKDAGDTYTCKCQDSEAPPLQGSSAAVTAQCSVGGRC